MKSRLIPVIFTAAATSVMTLFAVSRFQEKVPYFEMAQSKPQLPVNYAAYTNVGSAAPVNFENAAEGSVKAVVHINTKTEGRVITSDVNDVFSQLFGQQQYYIPPQKGSGSGVIISADGYVVTNNHVVADATEVTVTFNNRFTTKAKVIGTDPATDIAVLKVAGTNNMPYMEFGNSDDVKLGQWVLAVGYPLSLEATVTAGIVSAKGRSLGINRSQSTAAIESFIQTDAAVNPGNSGGALVNTAGQLVGINSAIASPTGSYAGYSYAIPANIVRKAVNDLMKYGSVQRAYMGIKYLDSKAASPEELAAYGLDKTEGVYVTEVSPNSGAAKAGIKKGDFITQINGSQVNCPADIQGQIARYKPGDNISVIYSRNSKPYNATVLLTNLNGTTDIVKSEMEARLLGATFRVLTDKEKAAYKTARGILVTNVGNGPIAKQTQMQKGFVITGANDIPINATADLQKAVSSSRNIQIAGFYPGRQGMYYYGLSNIDASLAEE
jgi:Do/DeqQ family serine protease